MEETSKRIRLLFKDKEDSILSQSQKLQGFKRCWVLLKPYHQTIHDLSSYILQAFKLHPSSPHGLILSMDDFVLPPFESTDILKDKDIISVRKKRLVLALEGNNAVNEELRVIDKQPVNGGALLLANEEFEKETGGYQSDEPEDELEEEEAEEKSIDESEEEDGEVHLEDRLHLDKSTGVGETSKKRKAPEKIQQPKKKKQKVHESIEDGASRKQAENAHQDGDLAKKEIVRKKTDVSNLKKKKDGTNVKKNVELNDSDTNTSSSETGSDEEGEDKASKGTRKGPSRSARRKKAKRQWIREMAKIKKQANVDQPKELKNWKQTSAPAKFERKKENNWKQKPGNNDWKQKPGNNDWKQKPGNNWKQNPDKAYSKEDDSEPKGLLHWKSWSAQDKSDDKSKEVEMQNASTSQQLDKKSSMDNEVVPVVIRPGHIRFEPREEDPENYDADQAVTQNQVSVESFQWNGITSKRKGQKWGTEKVSHTERKNDKDANGVQSHLASTSKETNLNHPIDFDKLPSLSCLPKEGDVIGYRLLELSSSWTPELSSFRVGQVSWCNPQSGKLLLAPVAEFPINLGKSDEDGSDQQPDNSLYMEDGSLEIEFSTLADARMIEDGIGGPRDTGIGGAANGGSTPMETAASPVTPASKDRQIQASVPGNGEVNHGNQKTAAGTENVDDLWEQVSEAVGAKKAELSEENSWGKSPKPKPPVNNNGTWSNRALKSSAMGPTMAFLRSKNKFRK